MSVREWVGVLMVVGLASGRRGDGDELCDAASRGDRATVERLLADGTSATARTDAGNTPAHCAATYGRRELVAELLSLAPELASDSGNPLGRTPLALAAQFGHAELVGALVDANRSSNSARNLEDRYGWTPLHLAVASGSRDTARALMWADALEVRTDLGRTPLHLAALAKDGPMLELLLAHGAKADARDLWGRTPLELWRGAGALERELVGTAAASTDDPPAFDATSAAPLRLHVACHRASSSRSELELVAWADGVVLFDGASGQRGVERRVGRLAPERLDRLLREVDESGLFELPPTRHGHLSHSGCTLTRVVDGRELERDWDGIDQSLSIEIDAEFRMFLRAFERAHAAALSAVPAEAWPLAVVAPDGRFRGIER